jgi:hypothetical protein
MIRPAHSHFEKLVRNTRTLHVKWWSIQWYIYKDKHIDDFIKRRRKNEFYFFLKHVCSVFNRVINEPCVHLFHDKYLTRLYRNFTICQDAFTDSLTWCFIWLGWNQHSISIWVIDFQSFFFSHVLSHTQFQFVICIYIYVYAYMYNDGGDYDGN